ncbi:MAG: hypothetical protein EAZ30_11635 [Betaproteobacteria bacterium]|nr:MAG: hypothetical protein EAZ30_11635 [Betaproteobacteria bacterium]
MNRRTFTQRTLLAAISVGVANALGGCGSGDSVDNLPVTIPSDWTGVLNTVVNTIKQKHILPWRNTSESEFDAKVVALRARIATLDDGAALAETMALIASLGDGHTSISGWKYARFLPVAFEPFSDGIFVTAAASSSSALIGHELISIAGVPAAQLLQRTAKLWPTENDSGVQLWGSVFLSIDIALRYAGVAVGTGGVEIELRDPNSATTAFKKITLSPTLESLPTATGTAPLPRFRQDPSLNYWIEYLAGTDVIYFRYRRCVDGNAVRSLLENFEQSTRGRVPRAIVLDVRGNEGGDSSVLSGFIAGLRSSGWDKRPGTLFLLSDRKTFSAGMDACLDMLELGAIHLGDVPSQRPNFLGNLVTYDTPRDGVKLVYPTRVATRVAGYPSQLVPTERLIPSAGDHFAGRDPVIARALLRIGTN